MNSFVGVTIVLLVALGDLLLFALVYLLHHPNSQTTNKRISSYTFGTSLFDLVILSLIRFCVLIGASIGVVWNNAIATQRIQRSSKLMLYFGCSITIYAILKILYCTSDNKGMTVKDWTLLSGTLSSCLEMYCCWKLLSWCKSNGCTLRKKNEYLFEEYDIGEKNCDVLKKDQTDNIGEKEVRKLTTGETVIKLLKLAKNDTCYIVLALIFLVSCSVGQILLPFYTGEIINYIVVEKSLQKFKIAMQYTALITFFVGFASGMRAGLFTFLSARYVLRLQNLLFASIMAMETGFFDIRQTGEITSRLTSDCTKVEIGVKLNLNVFLRNVFKIAGILFFMMKISWKLSIVTFVIIPITGAISNAYGQKYGKLSENIQNSVAHANESAEEAISSIRTVKTFAAEKDEIERYITRLNVTYNLRQKVSILVFGYRWSTELANLAMTLLILYYGGHLVIKNDLTGGHLVSFILYSSELRVAVEAIGKVYTSLMETVGASKKTIVYIERKPIVENKGRLAPPCGFEGEIQFKNVTFAYPSRCQTPVLTNLNFTAKKGEVVALVGPSGGGKTTVVNLLQHFYEPTHGNVMIDGRNVKEYDHAFIHTHMSLVQQEPVLFARTIAENITYGLSVQPTMETVKHYASLANAHTFIEEMSNSYDTQTGEKGIQLSGGQKQRIAIARALIRNPSILILDEATSALDTESECIIQQAINKNLSGRTIIVIAHRLSTVKKADKILVMHNGQVVEQGKHNCLIKKGGVYAGLLRTQFSLHKRKKRK